VSRPALTVIAGANGAGKSTLTAGNLDIFGAIPLLNPDVFVNILHANGREISAISAGKEVLRLAKEHLARRESFAVETTLSGKNYLQMMQYARAIDRGFEVVLIYIGTRSVEINLARIAKRVLAVAIMFLSRMFVDGIFVAFRIYQSLLGTQTRFYSSTTPMS